MGHGSGMLSFRRPSWFRVDGNRELTTHDSSPELHKTLTGVISSSRSSTSSSSFYGRPPTPESIPVTPDDEPHGALGLTTLHEPSPPTSTAVDIVFVHGLGGGSRKTWSYSADRYHYWPQAWLANDPAFADTRIHAYGYKSDWADRQQSILNIRDFAASLVGELKNNPSIRRSNTRIIFVCHSMGGCVVKKAYILARQDQNYKDLADRVHSIFFLGTPHRGSDLAAILKKRSIITWGSKPFVSDLVPESSTLRDINDTFRHYAPDLRLWSFYETLPATPRVLNKIVVERHSATLGYPNEEIVAINADHRQLCKFNSSADPNYVTLRNALHTAVDMIRSSPPRDLALSQTHVNLISTQPGANQESVNQRLRSFLGVEDTLEDELRILQLLQEPGSCLWFSESKHFVSWKAGKPPGILWLTGRPASGKSVLCSHVIEQVKSSGAFYSYFFFRQKEDSKSMLSDCLRSLVFQMAMQDGQVADKLLQLEGEGVTWDMTDELSVWNRLFIGAVFKLPSIPQHFWIIDGVDECANFNSLFTKRILATLPRSLRFFATSRPLDEIGRGLASLKSRVNVQSLSETDTLGDMRLFVTSRLRELDRLENDESVDAMCEKILEKSSGSFLWVRLVLQEFENAWTSEAMDAVLSEVPIDLQDMYLRMLQLMEKDRRRVKLVKSILTWVVLACRPLTVAELRVAVKLDINETLQNMSKAIPSLCHQLVFVDNADRVHILHATAREFLLDEMLDSEFAICGVEKHAHLSSLLLRYLTNDAFKRNPLPRRKSSGIRGFTKPISSFSSELSLLDLLDYAACFFSEHIYRGTSRDDLLMDELCTFLKGKTILSWIEHAARNGNLGHITRTATNLRGYLGRRMKYLPPMDPSAHLVDCWVTDLIRVAAKFRSQLLVCPSSIYYIIPSFCPSESIISKTFASGIRPSAITVRGIPPATWDDCLTRIDFERGRTTALSYDTQFFAVGLSTGQISLYDPHSVQRVANIVHPERVRMLGFSNDGEYLASSGAKTLTVWHSRSGTRIFSFPLQSELIAFTFLDGGEFLCAFASGELIKWNLDSGEYETISWRDSHDKDITGTLEIPEQPPSRAAFFTAGETVLLAVGYRNYPIFIWNALELQPLGQCEADENNGIDDMTFNPNPEIAALAVSYSDGRLCIFNYTTMAPTFTRPSVFANSIACSPDGRSLVTGSSRGAIEVFEFDQDQAGNTVLVPIYGIQGFDDSIRGVAFSTDGLRFVDLHDRQCRVWAPAALLRKDNELESVSDAAPPVPQIVGVRGDGEEGPEITSAMAVSSNGGGYVVAGRSNGEVVAFSAEDGKELGVLYRHGPGVSVIHVALGEARNLIVSADDSGRVVVVELTMSLPVFSGAHKLPATRVMLDRRFGAAVVSLLVNPSADRLLISGRNLSELCDLLSGQVLGLISHVDGAVATALSRQTASSDVNDGSTAAVAFQHPTSEAWFVLVLANTARVFCWPDFQELTTANSNVLRKSPTPLEATRTSSYYVGQGLVLELVRTSPSVTPRLHVWSASTFDPEKSRPESQPCLPTEVDISVIHAEILAVLGIVGQSTVLLIDANLWVYSMELRPAQAVPHARASFSSGRAIARNELKSTTQQVLPVFVRRHFFALSEWRMASGELRCAIAQRTGGTDFYFASREYIVVLQGGLEFSEVMTAG
ncbi:WD40-repeat-containing domain protein [Annulohypoxylon truncatum]|uniref:WD40-repeat-containing domain protein n=1 Tax=Annulohypoxylon truncatum TaxID=327061 RepID=UPI0020086913|nr:WD40-repeat-containing domain protein [Annulohypoxylon truncatum]KAI1209723.1 WD40-repeat-containing domain protein [Annulohypoxylon truncatum]